MWRIDQEDNSGRFSMEREEGKDDQVGRREVKRLRRAEESVRGRAGYDRRKTVKRNASVRVG
jgi:hypothetical protein